MQYEKGISIIIPIYNVEILLPQCLNSVLGQTYKDIEVICVLDKKNTDKSGEILNAYAQKDKRIKIIEDTTGKGQGYNRNLGIEAVTKEYIGFVDSDDYIDTTFYEQMIDAAEMFDSDVVMSDVKIINTATGNLVKERKYKFHAEYLLAKKIVMLQESVCWDKIYRTELIKDNPDIRFPEEVMHEDNLFTLKVMNNCKKLITSPNANYYWLRNEYSLSFSDMYAIKRLDDSNAVINMILDYLETIDTTKQDNIIIIDFFMRRFGWMAFKYYKYKSELTERINKLTL